VGTVVITIRGLGDDVESKAPYPNCPQLCARRVEIGFYEPIYMRGKTKQIFHSNQWFDLMIPRLLIALITIKTEH
jgi:hypothetical protein